MNYYNEWDPQAAAWLRELIAERLIPRGLVDERSITEVKAEDLEGFTQCHFFAGIGGWPLALQLAGVSRKTRLWTGSPPCQPFSAAGKQLGQFDPRHLAPVFLNLISECRPPVLFGEQVAPAIAKSWMCDLQTHLEGENYAVGFAVLPACSVEAPHKRERLFFGAKQLADTESPRPSHRGQRPILSESGESSRKHGGMAYTDDTRPQGWEGMPERADEQSTGAGSVENELAYSSQCGRRKERENVRRVAVGDSEERRTSGRGTSGSDCRMGNAYDRGEHPLLRAGEDHPAKDLWRGQTGEPFRQMAAGHKSESERVYRPDTESADTHNGFWSDADWLGCRDGKFRPVEPGTFPLANGIPARVGRLRGYGNAIVPQVAAEFIAAFMGAAAETLKG